MALQIHKLTSPIAIVEKAINGRADGYGFGMTWKLLSLQNESAI